MNLPASDPTAEGQDADPPAGPADARSHVAPEQSRPAVTRRKLDEIFGELLPSVTRDELDDPTEEGACHADADRWYRDNRPPHHG